MITLKPRIDFGGEPWPTVVSSFDLSWLTSQFVPAQRQRLDKVTSALEDGKKRIESARSEALTPSGDLIGTKLASGTVLQTPADQRLQRELRSHAENQVVNKIVQIRKALDKTVPPILRDMQRACLTAQALQERTFDKFSCLWRASAGMKLHDLAALKASYAQILAACEPIELSRVAQRAIDDGSVQSLILIDCILRENFRRPRSARNFLNPTLLDLVNVPEYNEAGPLLQQVVDFNNEALTAWADFSGQVNRATTLRMGQELGRMALKQPSIAPQQ